MYGNCAHGWTDPASAAYREREAAQVRKTPSWPRSWASFALLLLCFHGNAWANSHLLGQPSTLLAACQSHTVMLRFYTDLFPTPPPVPTRSAEPGLKVKSTGLAQNSQVDPAVWLKIPIPQVRRIGSPQITFFWQDR